MISHEFQPIAAVGGDFLDYLQLTDGRIGLYLGDVSGKGLPAAGCTQDGHFTARRPCDLGRVFAAVVSFARGWEQHDDMAAALLHLCS